MFFGLPRYTYIGIWRSGESWSGFFSDGFGFPYNVKETSTCYDEETELEGKRKAMIACLERQQVSNNLWAEQEGELAGYHCRTSSQCRGPVCRCGLAFIPNSSAPLWDFHHQHSTAQVEAEQRQMLDSSGLRASPGGYDEKKMRQGRLGLLAAE